MQYVANVMKATLGTVCRNTQSSVQEFVNFVVANKLLYITDTISLWVHFESNIKTEKYKLLSFGSFATVALVDGLHNLSQWAQTIY